MPVTRRSAAACGKEKAGVMQKSVIDLNGKTILVTGSPGFIGSYLVIRLLRKLSGGDGGQP